MPKKAVIGSGRVGSTLGCRLLAAGWEVHFGSRDPAHSRSLKQALRAQPAAQGSSIAEAVGWADQVVLVVPGSALASDAACASFARSLGPHAGGKVFLDATNPLDTEGTELCWERGRSSAEVLQEALPGGWVGAGWMGHACAACTLVAGPRRREPCLQQCCCACPLRVTQPCPTHLPALPAPTLYMQKVLCSRLSIP